MTTKAKVMKDEAVKIMLADKEFGVKFDLNALCLLQDKFGSFEEAFGGLDNSDFKKIRSLLHAGLANGENEDITEKEVGALIDMKNINEVVSAITTAFSEAMPSTEDEGK